VRTPAVTLTDRDADLLVSLFKHRYLSTSQLQRLHFPSLQTATRRLRLLAGAGYVSTFRSPAISDRIATLTRDGAEAVAERLRVTLPELGWDARRQHPKDYLFLEHFLAATDFRITLTLAAARQAPDLEMLGFLPEHLVEQTPKGAVRKYIRDVIADVQDSRQKISHAPDGVFALARSGSPALFFLEIDRGTETLSNPERGVLKTIRFYLNYLLGTGFQRYREDFGASEPFKGFRVLMVISSGHRLDNIRSLCGRLAFDPPRAKRFVWLTTQDAVLDSSILTRRWVSLDPADDRSYQIVAEEAAPVASM